MTNLTILTNPTDWQHDPVRLNKQFHADGTVTSNGNAKYFTIRTLRNKIESLDHLQQFLKVLEDRPDACIVRGSLVDNKKEMPEALRRSTEDEKTGEPPTICDEATNWICLDIDKFPILQSWQNLSMASIARCIVDMLMPKEFHGRRFILKLSSSSGKSGNWNQFSAHLFFWNITKLTCEELARYFKHNRPTYSDPNGVKQDLLDPALFRCAQIIYTASPDFLDGLPNPLIEKGEERIQLIEGEHEKTNLAIPDKLQHEGTSMFNYAHLESLVREIEYEFQGRTMPDDVFARIGKAKCAIETAKTRQEKAIEEATSPSFTNALIAHNGGQLHYDQLMKMTCAFRNIGVPQHQCKNTVWACRYSESSFTAKQFMDFYTNPARSGNQCGLNTLRKFAGLA